MLFLLNHKLCLASQQVKLVALAAMYRIFTQYIAHSILDTSLHRTKASIHLHFTVDVIDFFLIQN